MSSTGFGQGPKKETVYNGPTAAMGSASAYGGVATKPVKETVYGDPGAPGTLYGGSGAGGTVYNPAKSAGARAETVPSDTLKKTANVFFVIAGFSLINVFLLTSGARFATAIGLGVTRVFLKQTLTSGGKTAPVFLLTALLIAVFVGLGVFARRGSGAAFLAGLLLYGADTAILCWDGFGLHVPSIVIHAIFLLSMFQGYRLTQE
ncbi:MAG TPA: hypothetical protein VKY85_17110 [Candidatus Angelobacter sp.]|nr:hypothetical protein [Candidatus Angelobacter sp.]